MYRKVRYLFLCCNQAHFRWVTNPLYFFFGNHAHFRRVMNPLYVHGSSLLIFVLQSRSFLLIRWARAQQSLDVYHTGEFVTHVYRGFVLDVCFLCCNHFRSLTHIFVHSFSPYLTHAYTCTRTHTHARAHTHTCTCTQIHTYSHTLTRTHSFAS